METPEQIITKLFIATDQLNWETVEECLAEKVLLDYSSMNGNPATELNPQQIIEAWQGILPGFEHTHHQLGNFMSKMQGEKATVFCYGTATHYLPHKQGNVWTVVGTYNFELQKGSENNWQIQSMKFNFKYIDGNGLLPNAAIERVRALK